MPILVSDIQATSLSLLSLATFKSELVHSLCVAVMVGMVFLSLSSREHVVISDAKKWGSHFAHFSE